MDQECRSLPKTSRRSLNFFFSNSVDNDLRIKKKRKAKSF
jgi:hypothetical protein